MPQVATMHYETCTIRGYLFLQLSANHGYFCLQVTTNQTPQKVIS